jgi:Peptidase propeptide and YPEB domain
VSQAAANRRFAYGSLSRRLRVLACATLPLAMVGAVAGRPVSEPVAPTPLDAEPTAQIAQRGSLSLQEATAMATRQVPGRVVRAEPVSRGGRVIYEIRILGEDGRVRTVRIDAETGQML